MNLGKRLKTYNFLEKIKNPLKKANVITYFNAYLYKILKYMAKSVFINNGSQRCK